MFRIELPKDKKVNTEDLRAALKSVGVEAFVSPARTETIKTDAGEEFLFFPPAVEVPVPVGANVVDMVAKVEATISAHAPAKSDKEVDAERYANSIPGRLAALEARMVALEKGQKK